MTKLTIVTYLFNLKHSPDLIVLEQNLIFKFKLEYTFDVKINN